MHLSSALRSVHWVFICDWCAAVSAEMLIPSQCLHAEGDEAQAADPAAYKNDDETEQPLEGRLFIFSIGLASLTTRVTLHFKWFNMSGWDAVWSDEWGRCWCNDVLDGGGNRGLLTCDRLHDLSLLHRVQVSYTWLLLGHSEHWNLFLW